MLQSEGSELWLHAFTMQLAPLPRPPALESPFLTPFWGQVWTRTANDERSCLEIGKQFKVAIAECLQTEVPEGSLEYHVRAPFPL